MILEKNDFSYKEFIEFIKTAKQVSDIKDYLNQFVPDTLYKYYKLPLKSMEQSKREKRLSILKKEEVWLSKKAILNDPFELDLIVINNLNVFEKEYYEDVCNKNVFFCMTKGYDNKLMWSHYANGHKGYCVEFHKKVAGTIYPVEYIDKRMNYTKEYHEFLNIRKKADYNIQLQETDELLSWALSGMKCMKESCWKYEEEYRMVESTEDGIGKRIKAKDLGLEISKIICGLKCSEADIEDLKQACATINRNRFYQFQRKQALSSEETLNYLRKHNKIVQLEKIYCDDNLKLYPKAIPMDTFG